MGSATREALAAAVHALATLPGNAEFETGEQLLEAARIIGGAAQLRAVLADDSAAVVDKREVIGALFGSYTAAARGALHVVVAGRWSSEDDLVAGVEELGIRAVAASAPASLSIEAELFAFLRAVRSDSQLELAVGSKLGAAEAKVSLVQDLLGGKASPQTTAIVRHLVQQPRGRRIGELLRYATSVVADQAGLAVATVSSARPIADDQLERLRVTLAEQYGRGIRINFVLDPGLIGGLRVQIGDDVIDGSVATRLNELRLQLAG